MYQREHLELLRKRITEERLFIQCISGPRQVGKTTTVKQLLESISMPYHFVSADESLSGQYNWIEQHWETARLKLVSSQSGELLLVFDEIQKINNWSETVKAQWDKDTFNKINIKVILLGSARLLFQKGLSESLAGRFEIIPMFHWSFPEMKEAFGYSPEQYAWFGGYPGASKLIDDESRWKQYILDSLIEATISKDVLSLSRIDKPALLRQLFELGCSYSGQIFSLNKMLGQLQDSGNVTTLAHYLELLDIAGLLTSLERFSMKMMRTRSSIPKLQVYNNALLTVSKNEKFENAMQIPELWGRLVESAIGAHLLNASKTQHFNLYYWRDRNDEVDFILEKSRQIVGIEVKSGRQKNPEGMKAFKQRYPQSKILLISNAGISWQEFLTINPEQLF